MQRIFLQPNQRPFRGCEAAAGLEVLLADVQYKTWAHRISLVTEREKKPTRNKMTFSKLEEFFLRQKTFFACFNITTSKCDCVAIATTAWQPLNGSNRCVALIRQKAYFCKAITSKTAALPLFYSQ